MTIKPLRHFLLACFVLAWATLAHADIIITPPSINFVFDASNQSSDTTDYEGNFFDGTSAPYDITIGTFSFMSLIPTGYRITGATISGTFGDGNGNPTTALADLFVDGSVQVGACDSFSDPCFAGTIDGSLVPWSQNLTAGELSSGSLTLTAVQNSFGALIVGTPTLDIQIAPTPEPATIFPLAGGLLALAVLRRRK